MEQDRFDDLAKKVFSGSSRRRVLGGALASLVGAGVATVAGVDAKNKGKGKAKKGKGKAKGEFTCSGPNGGPGNPCGAGECCQSTPAGNNPTCVNQFAQLNSQTCGSGAAGDGVCRTCPTGTKCGLRNGVFTCICDSSTCATGCCIPGFNPGDDEVCVQNGSGAPVNSSNPNFDGAVVCGTAGSICNVCGDTLFSGCCTANGACSAGTSNANCGSGGALCETCQNDSSCGIDQACTGGTTTTTAAPTTTTAAPCGFTKGGNPKVTCGTACCGPKRGCNGAGTKCGKK